MQFPFSITMLRVTLGIILIAFGNAFGVSHDARAQAPSIGWQKCIGGSQNDEANCVIQTSDGGYLAAGYSLSSDSGIAGYHSNQDALIVKLSSTGSILWQKCYGGSGIDGFFSIIQTSDGGFAAVGITTSNDGDVTGNHGNLFTAYDGWVVKLNSAGAIQWQKCLGG